VFRNGISSDGSWAPSVVLSLAESDDVGLDMDFAAVVPPTAPCRASMLLGGRNIRLNFPRLCNAEVTEVIISG